MKPTGGCKVVAVPVSKRVYLEHPQRGHSNWVINQPRRRSSTRTSIIAHMRRTSGSAPPGSSSPLWPFLARNAADSSETLPGSSLNTYMIEHVKDVITSATLLRANARRAEVTERG